MAAQLTFNQLVAGSNPAVLNTIQKQAETRHMCWSLLFYRDVGAVENWERRTYMPAHVGTSSWGC